VKGEEKESKEGAIAEELRKDLSAGVDAISRFFDSDWWTWK
jgi:hypothetical protein